MWLNAGIDTGNIITTETIDIRNAIDLKQAHRMVMEHAHDLYIRAVEYLFSNTRPFNSGPSNPSVKGSYILLRCGLRRKENHYCKIGRKGER
ncbi:MAG: hypothetical protein IPK57_05175 [Chitinophagaceae bacterium]|nr:hypothetical protein [Chitinophagaceae bacterium]